MTQIEKIEFLKLKLSSITQRNIIIDKEMIKLKQTQTVLADEFSMIKTTTELRSHQLQELRKQISSIRHQISLVDICSSSEKTKVETLKTDLYSYRKYFDEFFDKAQYQSDLRKRQLKQNEEEQKQIKKQKEIQRAEKIEQLLKDLGSTEKQCEDIERECIVLKKRNNAIMLKLRRKLVESENKRKELMKKNKESDVGKYE